MRGLRTRDSSTPIPRSSACATSLLVRSMTSIRKRSTSDRASQRSRHGSGMTRTCADCRRSSASSLTRRGACRLATLTRTCASRLRQTECSPSLSRATMGSLRNARPAKRAMSRRDSALRFSPLRALAKRRRGGCGRWSSAKAQRRSSRRRLSERSHASGRNGGQLLREVLGAHAYGAEFVVGAAAAFGEMEAARFKALIERARALNAHSLRLTPWRAFLIAGLDGRGAEALVDSMADLGFVIDAADPRLRIAACPGGPACMHGHRRVRDDATRWAAMLPEGDGVILHVSGCAKGCARPAATAATFTATATGYDLILDGRAGDPPARRGLSSAEVAHLLASDDASPFAGARPT